MTAGAGEASSTRALRGKRNIRRSAATDLDPESDDEREQQGKEQPITAEERAIFFARLTPFVSKAEWRSFQKDLRSSSATRSYLSLRCELGDSTASA